MYDVWGRRMKESSMGVGPATDFFWRLISPVYAVPQRDIFVGDLVLMRFNMKNPDAAYRPDKPDHHFTFRKEQYFLNEDEYAEYTKLSGEFSRKYVGRLKLDPDNPTEKQVERIKRMVKLGRQHARNRLRPSWLGRIRKSAK